jgi:hypothetical protein
MRWLKYAWIPGVALVALGISIGLYAQPVVQNSLTGNECWNAGQGPGGPSTGFICSFQTRASLGYLNAGTGTTGTVNLTAQQNAVMFTGQPSAGLTLNLPTTGVTDGAIETMCNITNAALVGQTITVAAVSPATITAGVTTTLTTLAARTCVKYFYVLSTNTWGQVQ